MVNIKKETPQIRKYLEENIDKFPNKKACFIDTATKFNKTWKSIQHIWYSRTRPDRPQKNKEKDMMLDSKNYGLDGFKAIHSKSEIKKTKSAKMREKVEALINGDLKKAGWMYDQDVRDRLGFSAGDHAMLRNDYEHLIIYNVPDANNRRSTIWGHPDIINSMREAVNE